MLTNFNCEHLARFATVRRQHLHKQAILASYREVIPPLGFSCLKRQAHLGENVAFGQRKICREENRLWRFEPQAQPSTGQRLAIHRCGQERKSCRFGKRPQTFWYRRSFKIDLDVLGRNASTAEYAKKEKRGREKIRQ